MTSFARVSLLFQSSSAMGSFLQSPQEEDVGPPWLPPTSSRDHFVSRNYSQASDYSFILLPIFW